MSLEPILEGAECWCRSNVGGQTVPHCRTSDGECPIAKTKSGARDDEVSTSCRAESDASGNW